MDPPHNQGDQTSANPDRDAPDGMNPPAPDRQPQHSAGFTVIPPDESRRSKIRTMAQKEEEDLQRWKEANRPPPVHPISEKLGGNATLVGARQKQHADSRVAKLQKKIKKEDDDKKRRQEEEAKNQKMKDEQRQKAERLEEKEKQEEQRRRELLSQDHIRKTEKFLQRFERTAPAPLASGRATQKSSWSEAVESKQGESRSERDVQQEHRRVNSDFLDKLEGRGSEKETEEEDSYFLTADDFRHQPSNPPGQQPPLAHLNPEHSYSFDWTEEAELEPDYYSALTRLMSSFPHCSRVFLEDILDQCKSDYEQAYTLLYTTQN